MLRPEKFSRGHGVGLGPLGTLCSDYFLAYRNNAGSYSSPKH